MRMYMIAAAMVVCGLVGCSSSDVAEPVAKTPALSGPAAAATTFMTLLSKGDIATAETMLTDKSREKLNSSDRGFRDPGFGEGAFKIGRVEQATAHEAVVQCMVSMPSSDGQAAQAEICWCMREDAGVWRVLGFAVQDASLPQPIIWNFETDDEPQMAAPEEPQNQPPQTVASPASQPAASTAQLPSESSNLPR